MLIFFFFFLEEEILGPNEFQQAPPQAARSVKLVLMNPRKEGMVNEHTPSEQTNVQRDNGDVRRVLCVRVKRMQIQYA